MLFGAFLQGKYTAASGHGCQGDQLFGLFFRSVRMSAKSQPQRRWDGTQPGGREADHYGGKRASEYNKRCIQLEQPGQASAFPKKAADQRSQTGQQADN
ncbi:hypothetical protein D3C75_1069700 [compost metagenome]